MIRIMEPSKKIKLDNIFNNEKQKIEEQKKEFPFSPEDLKKIKSEIRRMRKNDSNVRYITSTSESIKQVEQSDYDNSKLLDSIFSELKSIKTEIKKITGDIEMLKLKEPIKLEKLIPGELAHGLACTLLD